MSLVAQLLEHPYLAKLAARDGGQFAKLSDNQIKYGVEPHDRVKNADDYGTYLNTRVRRKRKGKWEWVTAKPRMTCTCGKNVAQKIDGTPWAHTCKEVER